MAPFGGWEMPIDYGSILEEHRATRTAVGLFDLSHMGEFYVSGPAALDLVSALITNDPTSLAPGRGQYSPMCRDDGTIVDDVIVYHLPEPSFGQYLIVVNAANIAKDWAWIERVRALEGLRETTTLDDRSAHTALLAAQGPRAVALLDALASGGVGCVQPGQLRSFGILPVEIGGIPALAARTGYTGEDGFELFVAPERAAELWRLLLEQGAPYGLRPVGLGARDTLRLEARLPLYGNDITDETTPLEAGLTRFVKLEKPRFQGLDALRRQQQQGLSRKLVGLEMADRAVPRAYYPVLANDGRVLGTVTSGSFSPTRAKGIALAYVPVDYAPVGTALQVEIRGQGHPAIVVKTPFYRRAKEGGPRHES
jgi:aminomethyltransferase